MKNQSILLLILLALTVMLFAGGSSVARAETEAALIVNSANDANDGQCNTTHCSLREAVMAADLTPELDQIKFKIPADSSGCVNTSCRIQLSTPLPYIMTPVIINGYSQPGATTNNQAVGHNAQLKITLDGTISHGTGLALMGGNSTVRGLVIVNFSTAIWLFSENNLVKGNFIGVEADGVTAAGNKVGLSIDRDFNQIGGLETGDRNVISAQTERAMMVYGSNTVIQNNYMGVGKNGILDLGNGIEAIFLHKTSNNLVGGDTAAARNVMSGNDSTGMSMDDTANSVVKNNYIGVGADGTTAVPNDNHGISLSTDDASPPTEKNLITENVIAHNGGSGIVIYNFYDEYIQHNTFSRNRIWDNDGLGIDIENDGVTANDPLDADEDANGRTNFPVLVHAKVLNGKTIINGKVQAAPNKKYRVEIFINNTCDADTYGEGQNFWADVTVTTDGAGQAEWEVTKDGATNLAKRVTTTATQMQGLQPRATSEFSKCVAFKLPN